MFAVPVPAYASTELAYSYKINIDPGKVSMEQACKFYILTYESPPGACTL